MPKASATSAILVLFLILSPQASGWNGLGHRVIADIAWQQLDEPTQKAIARTLRRHPRFNEDFAQKGDIDDDRWVFQQAAVWPDIARGKAGFDQPTWHYINHPLFVDGKRSVDFNLAVEPTGASKTWNAAQAIAFCKKVVAGDYPPKQKAVAYCWLLHLVGDLHQPMHSTALVCDRFPNGDRGGNDIPVKSSNLHSTWDNLLGREQTANDVKRAATALRADKSLWTISEGDVESWIDESHKLAEFAYSPEIISAVQAEGELTSISPPNEYYEEAGAKARARVVAAGLRLGSVLGAESVAPSARQLPGSTTEKNEFEIISDETFKSIKRTVDVRLKERVSEEVLRTLADKIKEIDPNSYERTYILYYLPGMEIDAGAWASTHFNPDLEVKVLGSTVEEQKDFATKAKLERPPETVGRWIASDQTGFAGVITIFKEGEKFKKTIVFGDGSEGTYDLATEKVDGKVHYKEDGRDTSDYQMVLPNGDLAHADDDGVWAVSPKSP